MAMLVKPRLDLKVVYVVAEGDAEVVFTAKLESWNSVVSALWSMAGKSRAVMHFHFIEAHRQLPDGTVEVYTKQNIMDAIAKEAPALTLTPVNDVVFAPLFKGGSPHKSYTVQSILSSEWRIKHDLTVH